MQHDPKADTEAVKAALATSRALLKLGADDGLQQQADTLLSELACQLLDEVPEPLANYLAGGFGGDGWEDFVALLDEAEKLL